jgi:hypothetical protein
MTQRARADHEQMFDFGVECLKTGRFDTYVPYQLMKACERIDYDAGKDFALYRDPEVYRTVHSMFQQFQSKAPKHLDHAWYQTYHMGIAWRAGQYRDAAALLQTLGEHVRPNGLEMVQGWPPFVISQIQAMTSKHAPRISEAEADFAGARNYAAAIGQYQDVLGAMEKLKDDPGLLFVRYRLKQLQVEKDFYDGKEVSLTPGADFSPWYVQAGDWKRDKDGALLGATKNDGERARLLCNADFGPSYELSAKVQGPDPQSAMAALYVGVSGSYFSYAGIRGQGEVFIVSSYESRTVPQQLQETNELVLRVNGKQMSVLLNGKSVGQIHILPPTRNVRVGLGIPTQDAGCSARFSDVKIKLLGAVGEK